MNEIKNNGDTIKYESIKRLMIDKQALEINVDIVTDNDYSVETVLNLVSTSIPLVITDIAGEDILYHIKNINMTFTKYNNLNLRNPLHKFMINSSTMVIHSSDWKVQWNDWCSDFLYRLKKSIPQEDVVIQSSNKINNYLRIVATQFPPIEMYDITITPRLLVHLVGESYLPILMYDILYVTQSPKDNVNTVKDLWNDSFPMTYDQLENRILFFSTNYDIKINLKFKVGGKLIDIDDTDD